MIDFSKYELRSKTYGGANGRKISVLYNEELYMLKFPSVANLNDNMSYANGCFSEHLGSHIFNSIGIEAQETLLGTFWVNGQNKIIVACKDFTMNGLQLQDFASLKNTIVDSPRNGYGTELSEIEEAINEQKLFPIEKLKTRFWDMFIVDALLSNWDRHNGNWGFLYNSVTDEIKFAPIYDCGSCLFPQADEEIMKKVINNPKELQIRVYERPVASIKINDKKIRYFDYIYSLENSDCNEALKRIMPKIDMRKIDRIIIETPYATNLQKEFYHKLIEARKELILDVSYNKLVEQEKEITKPKKKSKGMSL